jgi:RNA polymerase sporulation-specific sigma factor
MSYKAYNDYELLYLFKEKHNQKALEILIKKYEKFIYKKVISFFPRKRDIEDYFQEGLLCLYRAINSFNDKYNKTFMRYFEVILDRHLINLYHKNKREDEKTLMLINEATVNEQIAYEEPKEETKIDVKLGSKLEELIYLYYYIEGKSVNYLSKKLKLSKKQVYNGIYRVKRKLSEQLKEKDKNLLIKK